MVIVNKQRTGQIAPCSQRGGGLHARPLSATSVHTFITCVGHPNPHGADDESPQSLGPHQGRNSVFACEHLGSVLYKRLNLT